MLVLDDLVVSFMESCWLLALIDLGSYEYFTYLSTYTEQNKLFKYFCSNVDCVEVLAMLDVTNVMDVGSLDVEPAPGGVARQGIAKGKEVRLPVTHAVSCICTNTNVTSSRWRYTSMMTVLNNFCLNLIYVSAYFAFLVSTGLV